MTYHQRDNAMEFKVREDQSLDIGRSDKDDVKFQSAQTRSGLTQRAVDLKEQVFNSELGQQVLQQGHFVADRVKEITERCMAGSAEHGPKESKGMERKVHKVLSKQTSPSGVKYQIHWAHDDGAPCQSTEEGITWEPVENLTNCPLVDEFDQRLANSKQKVAELEKVKEQEEAAASMAIQKQKDEGANAQPGASPYMTTALPSEITGVFSPSPNDPPPTPSTSPALPSAAQVPEAVGMDAAAGWEHIMHDTVKPALESIRTTAQNFYADKVVPTARKVSDAYLDMASTVMEHPSKARDDPPAGNPEQPKQGEESESKGTTQGEGGELRQRRSAEAQPKNVSVVSPLRLVYESKVPLRQREQLGRASKRVSHMTHLAWSKVVEVWAGEEPMVRSWVHRVVLAIQRAKLEMPVMVLGTILVLCASVSFMAWMALPPTHTGMPALYHAPLQQQQQPQQFHPSTGPIQGAELPGFTDKLKMSVDRATDAIPSMQEIKDAVPSLGEMKERATEGLESARNSLQHPVDVNSDRLDSLKERVQHGVQHGVEKLKETQSDIALKVQDRLHHAADALHVPSMQAIRDQANEIKDNLVGRFTTEPSQQQPTSPVNNDAEAQKRTTSPPTTAAGQV